MKDDDRLVTIRYARGSWRIGMFTGLMLGFGLTLIVTAALAENSASASVSEPGGRVTTITRGLFESDDAWEAREHALFHGEEKP